MMPLWRQAFRPFFLFGTAFSMLAIPVWVAVLSGKLSFAPYGGALFWHAHEMLFGFVSAIVVGFLLTAVQNWTGLRATHGWPLVFLTGTWLGARATMAFPDTVPAWLPGTLDLAVLPMAALFLGRLVVKAGNFRNLMFVPILILLTGANLLTHLSVWLYQPELQQWGQNGAIMLVTMMMVLISGRVFPMFTANGTGTPKVPHLVWLERTVLVLSGILAILFVSNLATMFPRPVLGVLFAIAALAHTYRALRWRPWVTIGAPLVWSLHLAYAFIPAGFALFALHFAGFEVPFSAALHSLTAGAMATMILAMIARISLGHSGRPLVIHWSMKWAFLSLSLAALSRVLIGIWPLANTIAAYWLIGLLWALSFLLFLVNYSQVLTSPRADGRPG